MNTYLSLAFVTLLSVVTAFAADDVASAVQGTVKKIDADTRTVVVKTADGTEETFRYMEGTTVHGVDVANAGARKTLRGLKEGSEVAVHYTTKDTKKTAHEIDEIGQDGLKTMEGTVETIDRGARTITLKTADGSEETYRLADRAARDTGRDIGEGAEKSARVTVYYTEDAGHKVAHFFKRVL